MMALSWASGQTVEGDTAMIKPVYYMQECPTCGRTLQIRVAHLGKRVMCQHCSAEFEACDPASKQYPPHDSGLELLLRADELLATVSRDRGFAS
jgi:lysine biosynthesis protein LysW